MALSTANVLAWKGSKAGAKVDAQKAITRRSRFADFNATLFNATFAFLTQVALLTEKMDRHLKQSNAYNRVEADTALAS